MTRFNVSVDAKIPETITFTQLIEADTIWDAVSQMIEIVQKEEVLYKARPEDLDIIALEIVEKLVNKKLFE